MEDGGFSMWPFDKGRHHQKQCEQNDLKPLSPDLMSRSDMGKSTKPENETSSESKRRLVALKRKRIGYLKHVFQHKEPEPDRRVTRFRLTREEVGLIEQARAASDAGIWKHCPNDLYEILVEGRIIWQGVPIKARGTDYIPDKGIVLMALKLLNLYFIGATPYHGILLREMYGVSGKEMHAHDLTRRANRGALYAQVEELGARVEDLADEDFDFDGADWDEL